MKDFKTEILKINENLVIVEDAPMSKYTSFKAGGNAKALIDVTSIEDLKALLQLFHEKNVKHMILGNGSNTLFKDSGYDGIVLRNMINDEIVYVPFTKAIRDDKPINMKLISTLRTLSI